MDFPRKHPDCDHCGTFIAAVTKWSQHIHDTCPCICHAYKTSKVMAEQVEEKKTRRKRK